MPANPFDQASRYLAKLDPIGFLHWLLPRLAAPIVFRQWLDTRTVPFPGDPDRTGDTVAALVDPAAPDFWWAVTIEFQTRPDRLMFGRVLEYEGRLWREGRPPEVGPEQFGVVAVVVNLTGRGTTGRDLRLGRTGLRTCLQVGERDLVQLSASATLRGIAAGRIARCVLPFIPLMQGGADPAIMSRWKRLAGQEPDDRRRGDYGGLALVFADLTGCREVWKEALRGWNVEQSLQVLEWQAEAEQRGKAIGKAEAILQLLQMRFPATTPAKFVEITSRVQSMKDLAQLNHWFTVAATATTFDEFRHLIQE